jgi:tetratricopeptide (TPR) repeat protein
MGKGTYLGVFGLVCAALLLFLSPAVGAQQMVARPAEAIDRELVETLVVQHFAEKAANDARLSALFGTAFRQRDAVIRASAKAARELAVARTALARSRSTKVRLEFQISELQARILSADTAYNQAIAENAAMVADIGRRDRTFAAEVTAYRGLLLGIVGDASPEKRALLREFATGDQARAYLLLAELTDLEQHARVEAAAKITAELQQLVKEQEVSDQRLLGILAFDALARHRISVEVAMKPWTRIVDSGAAERADYLALASLATSAGDDRRAAELIGVADKLETRPEVKKSFPIFALLEAQVTNRGGSGWRLLAELARHPQPAYVLPDGRAGASLPIAATPLTPEFAPLLDGLADCEEALLASADWSFASRQADVDRRIGLPGIKTAPIADEPTPASTRCAPSADGLARLLSTASASPLADSLVGASAILAYALAGNGDEAGARAMSAGATVYCRGTGTDGAAPSTQKLISCAMLNVVVAAASAKSDPGATVLLIDRALARLDRADIGDLPVPELAWSLPYIYVVAADILESAGNLPEAARALAKAHSTSEAVVAAWIPLPATRLRPIEMLVQLAELRGKIPGDREAGRLFNRAQAELSTFMLRTPNSVAACALSDDLFDAQLDWHVRTDIEHALDSVEQARAIVDSCDMLDMAVLGSLPGADRGVTARKIARQAAYLQIGDVAQEHGMAALSRRAFALLANETQNAMSPAADEMVVKTFMIAAKASGIFAFTQRDFQSALHWFRQLAEVSRIHASRVNLLIALERIGTIESLLGHPGVAAEAWRDKLRLCATALTGRPMRHGTQVARLAELDLQTVDLGCRFAAREELEAARGLLEAQIAMAQAAGAGPAGPDRLADALFHLGVAFDQLYDLPRAVDAYDRPRPSPVFPRRWAVGVAAI